LSSLISTLLRKHCNKKQENKEFLLKLYTCLHHQGTYTPLWGVRIVNRKSYPVDNRRLVTFDLPLHQDFRYFNRIMLLPMKFPDRTPAAQPKSQVLINLSILIFTIWSDQHTKSLAANYLINEEQISLQSGIIVFSYVENSAGFLGILSELPGYIQFFLLNICVTLILLYCLYYLFSRRIHTVFRCYVLAVITGGGMSNLLDRIINNGRVIDFLQLEIGPIKTGIFNLADVYILAGSFLLGFLILATDS
jgi:signal peptidase II